MTNLDRRKEDKKYESVMSRLDCHETRLSNIEEDTNFLVTVIQESRSAVSLLCRMAIAVRFSLRYILLPIGFLVAVGYFIGAETWPAWFIKLKAMLR